MSSYSSRPQSPSPTRSASTESSQLFLSGIQPLETEIDRDNIPSGSFNDAYLIREVVSVAMRESGKSRAQLADDMSYLLGCVVTERMLNAFAAESREDHRFPAQFERAFAKATGDTRILTCRIEKAGFHVITAEESRILELGRQVAIKERAQADIDRLTQELRGAKL